MAAVSGQRSATSGSRWPSRASALIFFFSFVANWNNFFLPYVFLSDERKQPIQVGLSDLFRSSRPALALATLVAAVPVAVVFVVSQRTLLRGLVGGSTKG